MFTLFDFAGKVLENSSIPLSFQDIWKTGVDMGLDKNLSTTGKTPWQSFDTGKEVLNKETPNIHC